MAAMTRTELMPSQELLCRSFTCVQRLGNPSRLPLLPLGHKQEAGLEMEHPGLEPVPIWSASAADSCYIIMPAPLSVIKNKKDLIVT